MLHIFTLTTGALCACHTISPHYNLSFWACTCTLYELVTEEFNNYQVSWTEFLSTINAKRGTKTFNKEVCRAQCKVHLNANPTDSLIGLLK